MFVAIIRQKSDKTILAIVECPKGVTYEQIISFWLERNGHSPKLADKLEVTGGPVIPFNEVSDTD